MAYKGNDLDLRSARPAAPAREARRPAARSADAANGAAGAQPASAAPIRSRSTTRCWPAATAPTTLRASTAREDVRLEHLLHALTRVGAAAEVLAELGIRVDTLRRETAVAIAAEMPAGPIAGDGTPHASAAFEDVLRRAADQAAKRRAPAGLHDLLRTMLGGGPGSPAAALLMRAAADPQRLERWRDAPLRAALSHRRAGGGRRSPTSMCACGCSRCAARSSRSHGGSAAGAAGRGRRRSPGPRRPPARCAVRAPGAAQRRRARSRSPTAAKPSTPCSRRSSAISARRWQRSPSASPASTSWPPRATPGQTPGRAARAWRRSRAASARRRWTSPTASPTRSPSASARPRPACSACRRRPSGTGAPTASGRSRSKPRCGRICRGRRRRARRTSATWARSTRRW